MAILHHVTTVYVTFQLILEIILCGLKVRIQKGKNYLHKLLESLSDLQLVLKATQENSHYSD